MATPSDDGMGLDMVAAKRRKDRIESQSSSGGRIVQLPILGEAASSSRTNYIGGTKILNWLSTLETQIYGSRLNENILH